MAKQKRASVLEGSNPAEGEGKRKRVPIHASRNQLTVENRDPNYVYRWVNDVKEGTRVQRFLNAGYNFVDKDDVVVGDPIAGRETEVDSRASKVVGVNSEARETVRAYLMRIPRDWYDEDQKAKQDEIDELEKGMFRRAELPEEDLDGYYGKFGKEKKVTF